MGVIGVDVHIKEYLKHKADSLIMMLSLPLLGFFDLLLGLLLSFVLFVKGDSANAPNAINLDAVLPLTCLRDLQIALDSWYYLLLP